MELSRSVLSGWVDACCRRFSPQEEALQQYVLTNGKLHADDMPVPVLLLAIKRLKQVACGHMYATTVIPVQRSLWRCGLLTVQTEKGSTRTATLLVSADAYAGFIELYQLEREA